MIASTSPSQGAVYQVESKENVHGARSSRTSMRRARGNRHAQRFSRLQTRVLRHGERTTPRGSKLSVSKKNNLHVKQLLRCRGLPCSPLKKNDCIFTNDSKPVGRHDSFFSTVSGKGRRCNIRGVDGKLLLLLKFWPSFSEQ